MNMEKKEEEEVVKIPESFELKPRSRHRQMINKSPISDEKSNRKTLKIGDKDPGETIWTSMEAKMESNDDFFCIPKDKIPRQISRKKRQSSIGILVPPRPIDTADSPLANPDDEIPSQKISSFFSFLKVPKKDNEIAPAISKGLQEEMTSFLGRL